MRILNASLYPFICSAFFCCALICCVFISAAQESAPSKTKERQQKIESIWQIQDKRTVHDRQLTTLLTDKDGIVREHAVRAFGSLQDTTMISLLVDRLQGDDDPAVQNSAAFAIGQTASFLSKTNREILQHDLIWTRLEKTKAADRLIEEIGKFGTEEALKDLISKFGDSTLATHDSAMTLSIARFAIRGVTMPVATQYLVTRVISGRGLTWQKMYALQRIGNKVEIRTDIEQIARLFKHPDPLIRMNLAILLGKIKDERSCLEPLMKLAEYDGDWEVRVAAMKALGNFHLTPLTNVLRVFSESFNDPNPYISLSAISALGNADINLNDSSTAMSTLRLDLQHVAQNSGESYAWQVQGEAATTLAKLAGPSALPFVKPSEIPQRFLQAQLLNAVGATGTKEALPILKEYLGKDDQLLYRSALEGLQVLANKNPNEKELLKEAYDAAIASLESRDVAVVTTGASILGDSLLLNRTSTEPLLRKLDKLQIPDDIEAMQEIIASLGKIKDERAVLPLEGKLDLRDRSIVLAAAAALKGITGRDYSSKIKLQFEQGYTDFDFAYLKSLPETVKVKMETVRGNVMVELYKDAAPFTVMSFLKLATQRGFYRGLTFHRVVPTFVVQGGDPRGDGWGGAGYAIRSEFSPLTYEIGTLGIASAGKDTEGSQFFVTQTPQPHLDGRYTIFGKVVSGMDAVNKIQIYDHIYDIKITP